MKLLGVTGLIREISQIVHEIDDALYFNDYVLVKELRKILERYYQSTYKIIKSNISAYHREDIKDLADVLVNTADYLIYTSGKLRETMRLVA